MISRKLRLLKKLTTARNKPMTSLSLGNCTNDLIISKYFFKSQTVLFKVISTQVAQQAIFFQGKTVILTFLSDLLKDTLLRIEGKKPSIWWESKPQPLCYQVCALPLCYNRCPSKSYVPFSDWTKN